MPQYQYRCQTPGCGNVITRTRTFAEQDEALEREQDYRLRPLCKKCFGYTKRIFTPVDMIMRPSGWNLRPGDQGYGDFNREAELGELRGPSHSAAYHVAEDYETEQAPVPKPSFEQMREIHQLGEVMDNAIRERHDIPEE